MPKRDNAGIRAELMRKSDLCASALQEARRLSGTTMFGALFSQLDSRIADMLDELDEALLALDHTKDRGAFERVSELHRGYEELKQQRERLGVS
ncbi:MAG: hypothetical protein U1F41_12905 [Burkholderiales bacterium]